MINVLIVDSNTERQNILINKLNQYQSVGFAINQLSDLHAIEINIDFIIYMDHHDLALFNIIHTMMIHQKELMVLTNIKECIVNNNKQFVFFDKYDKLEAWLFNQINEQQQHKINDMYCPIAVDPESIKTLNIARKAAKSHATVLITGETGVGKEILAQYIHRNSLVSNGPFVSVNCAALPDNMIEAILFGYEKGAFTSAITNYIGKFEQAQNGTLLLDEISEISISLQAKLLRVIQEREIERLGGKKIIDVNVRIIAATNRNLAEQVKNGYFRKDLYYRLNVIPIHCESLQNRKLDIIPLAELFIQKHSALLGKKDITLSESAKIKLINYTWPGNIREMDNIIQHAIIMTDENVIEAIDIKLTEESLQTDSLSSKQNANEAKIIIDILNEVDGCRQEAAKILNISPRTLRYKLAKIRLNGLKIPNKMSREDSYEH